MTELAAELREIYRVWQNGLIQYEWRGYLKYWEEVFVFLVVAVWFPILVKFWWRLCSKQKGASPLFFSKLSPMWLDVVWGAAFVVTGLVVYWIALGPVYQAVERVPQKAAIKVVVGIDGSASSLAMMSRKSDVSRWQMMVSSVHRVFEKLPHDKKGFFIFAKRIFARSSTLTTDYARILRPELNDITEWFIAEAGEGTDFSYALRGCYQLLSKEDSIREGVCIILSDGEQQGDLAELEQNLVVSLKDLKAGIFEKNLKVKFYIVPVGDPFESLKIPRRDLDGNIVGFVCCQRDGRSFIETRPDYAFLERIAIIIEGVFVDLKSDETLAEALKDTIEKEREIVSYQTRIVRKDLSWLGFTLVALGVGFILIFW
jgi:hypothetical protein